VRVAFALDCCDREAMGHVAPTGGIAAGDVFSPGIWWMGSTMNRPGSDVQILAMYS
jgi:hypothetical protein